jgi:uncharacterized membrane protein YfcA
MLWMVFGAALGAASKDAGRGAENAITLFGFSMLAYGWLMIFRLKRQRAKRLEGRKTE